MSFLEELAARQRFGMRPGLETIRAVCSRLGNPERHMRAIHVAGTNGKGAVCAILDATLRAAGLRVGRYTSPHLVKLNERFCLAGAPVDDATLERLSERVFAAVNRQSSAPLSPTFFEALTAVAFLLYAEAKVDCAVLECGLGGRLDATNVCHPALCVVTRVGLDHCAWLGETVEKIAAEKAGILKPGVPVVLGENEPSVRAVVEARARDVGAPFYYAPDFADEREIPADFSLVGSFNRENAVTALAALKILAQGTGEARFVHPAVLQRGFSSVMWPGRFQRVGNVVLDGAHNPPAARALAKALAATAQTYVLIAGFCGDKDVEEVLSALVPFVRKGLAVQTNNPRSLSADQTAEKMRAIGLKATPCSSLRAALACVPSDSPTLICGSLFLVGESLVELGVYPWPAPRFDLAERLWTNHSVK